MTSVDEEILSATVRMCKSDYRQNGTMTACRLSFSGGAGITTIHSDMTESNKQKILMVDDDKDFAEILSTKLEKEGYDVVVAQNGELGVRAAKEISPSIILMDVQMPVMNGFEAFFKLKEDTATKNIKVVFLTNYGEPAKEAAWLDEKFAREVGAEDYIKKTDDLSNIVKNLHKLLD